MDRQIFNQPRTIGKLQRITGELAILPVNLQDTFILINGTIAGHYNEHTNTLYFENYYWENFNDNHKYILFHKDAFPIDVKIRGGASFTASNFERDVELSANARKRHFTALKKAMIKRAENDQFPQDLNELDLEEIWQEA